MTATSHTRRIAKLEATPGAADLAAMSDEELANRIAELNMQIGEMIANMDGKDATIVAAVSGSEVMFSSEFAWPFLVPTWRFGGSAIGYLRSRSEHRA